MTKIRQFLTCALVAALAFSAFEAALLFRSTRRTVSMLPQELALTRGALVAEVADTRNDLNEQIAAARGDLLVRSERQVNLLRKDLFAETDAIRATADRRIGDTLSRADAALTAIDAFREDIRPAVRNAAIAEQSASALMDTYRALPAQMASRFAPSWEKIEPEITCRLANGSGYGGCWHSRVTALLGEAANAGGVFTRKFPALADSTTGIAEDIHTFTSRAVAPRGFWGTFKDLIGTTSGVTRALGAAGVFDAQVATPKQ